MNLKNSLKLSLVISGTVVILITGCSSGNNQAAVTSSPTTNVLTANDASSPTQSPETNQSTPPSPSPTTADNNRCHTSQLSASFNIVPGSQGAGHELALVSLTNDSKQNCVVYGYVGMQLLDKNKHPLPTNVVRSQDQPTQVSLASGQTASASVRFSPDVPGTGEPTSKQCEPTSYYVEVTPPDETTHLTAKISPATPVCEHGSLLTKPLALGNKST